MINELTTWEIRYINNHILIHKTINERIHHALICGYAVKKCFTLRSNGYQKKGAIEYLPTKNVYRLVLGMKSNHLSREVYCIIFKGIKE